MTTISLQGVFTAKAIIRIITKGIQAYCLPFNAPQIISDTSLSSQSLTLVPTTQHRTTKTQNMKKMTKHGQRGLSKKHKTHTNEN